MGRVALATSGHVWREGKVQSEQQWFRILREDGLLVLDVVTVMAVARVAGMSIRAKVFVAVGLSVALFVAAITLGATSGPRTFSVGGVQVVGVARGASNQSTIPEAAAKTAGIASIAALRPDFTGFSLSRSTFVPGVLRASTAYGMTFTSDAPTDVWLIEWSAPAQSGWDHVVAVTVVEGHSGRVVASGVGTYNE
jgi:hypothetical protein